MPVEFIVFAVLWFLVALAATLAVVAAYEIASVLIWRRRGLYRDKLFFSDLLEHYVALILVACGCLVCILMVLGAILTNK